MTTWGPLSPEEVKRFRSKPLPEALRELMAAHPEFTPQIEKRLQELEEGNDGDHVPGR